MLHHHLKQHIHENRVFYLIVLFSLILGICVGQVQVRSMNSASFLDIQQWLDQSVSAYTTQSHTSSALFWSAFQQQLKILLGIWFLGMTLVGTPLILGLLFYRGAALGFTCHLLFDLHSWKGLGIFLTSVLPQNLVYVPCLLIWSVFALNLSWNLLKRRKSRSTSFSSLFFKYQLALPLFALMLAAGALIESWLSPSILHFML